MNDQPVHTRGSRRRTLVPSARVFSLSRLALPLLAVVLVAAPAALAFNCPVVIKQAEDMIRKAEGGKVSADSKPLIEEAKKQVAEAKAHHENAKTKRDHGDAVRKAKVAAAYAEEAIVLQNP